MEPKREKSEYWTLLTIKEVAERLGCSLANVYALIERGDLPVVAVGRRKGYRLDAADLDAFVAGRKISYRAGPVMVQAQPKKLRHLSQ